MMSHLHPAQRVLHHLRPDVGAAHLRPRSVGGPTHSIASAKRLDAGAHFMSQPLARSNQTARSGRLLGPLPLVGRTEELAALEALTEGAARDLSTMIVSGEGGVGKSRLVAELATRMRGREWSVAHGRAYPVETGVPYALFSDAFLPMLSEMDTDTLTVLSRGGQAELSYLFPALSAERDQAVGGADPDEFRTRLMWNFAEFLRNYATRTPLLVILEDLQWADESSLHLLHFLARQVSDHPIVIIGTYNEAERERNPELIRTERSLVALGVGDRLRIEPLTREQVTELLCRTFAVDPTVVKEFSALLYGWTRGNPFFLEEVVKSLVSSGRLSNETGAWVGWDADDFGLPGTIRDAVLTRLGTFSEGAQTVAELAAVIGARASYPLLASISGLAEGALLGALEELCAHRVLNEHAESGTVVYDFAHPLIQQTLYGEFGLQRARLLHGAVAEAMEAFYGPSAMAHADELAFHFARTDGSHLRGKAARYLAAAGHQALERRADQEAVAYLQAALDRVRDAEVEGVSTEELIPALARAHQHLGDYEAAAELWAAALEAVPADDRRHALLRRTLGMAHFWCGRHSDAHEQLDAGLEVARAHGHDAEVVRLLVAKGHCLHELGEGAEAVQTVTPALPIAEALGRPDLLARVHRSLALLHVWIGPPDEARKHGEKAIELADGDVSVEFWARWGLAVLGGMAGETGQMAAAIDNVSQLADRSRSPVLKLWTADMAIELEYGRGDWDKGIQLADQAISLARNLHQRTLLPRLLVWKSLFHVGRAELDEAKALVDEAVEMSGLDDGGPIDVHQVVPTYIGQAHYLVGLGDYHDAIEAAEKGLKIAEGTGYILWSIHRLLPILGEACLWAGEIDKAEQVGRRLREHAERLDHKLGSAWADACDALVQWKRGDAEGSVELMRRSAEALEEIPMIPYAARIRRQMAGRLAEIGDTERSIEELKRVHDIFVKLGADLELEKARTQFREIGYRPPPKGVGEGVAGLTPRELEVARLVARRYSNKAIGKELGMATRTASTHLSNIFQKLGLSSRGELADLVREKGLLEE